MRDGNPGRAEGEDAEDIPTGSQQGQTYRLVGPGQEPDLGSNVSPKGLGSPSGTLTILTSTAKFPKFSQALQHGRILQQPSL